MYTSYDQLKFSSLWVDSMCRISLTILASLWVRIGELFIVAPTNTSPKVMSMDLLYKQVANAIRPGGGSGTIETTPCLP